jgi:hypothetical protein
VEVEELLRKRFSDAMFQTAIRVNTHHKSAPSHKRTIFEHEPEGGKGREDYDAFAIEVLQRLGKVAVAPKTSRRRERVRKSEAAPSGASAPDGVRADGTLG